MVKEYLDISQANKKNGIDLNLTPPKNINLDNKHKYMTYNYDTFRYKKTEENLGDLGEQ